LAAIGRAAAKGTQRIELSHRQREQWINPEPRMVIEILVSQRQSMHALGEQLPYNMFDKSPITPVTEARAQGSGDFPARYRSGAKSRPRHRCSNTQRKNPPSLSGLRGRQKAMTDRDSLLEKLR